MSNAISVSDLGTVRTIAIDRPEKRNALTHAMYDALAEAFRQADADGHVTVICLTGTGDAFCSGNDLDDLEAAPPPASRETGLGGLFATLVSVRKPVIGAAHGVAVGIGATLLLHCDLVYASETTRLRLPFANLGLVPVGGSSRLLPELVGRRRASEILFFGGWIGAEEARAWGLVNEVFPMAEFAQRVAEKADRLAQMPTRLLGLTKALIQEATEPLLDCMDKELKLLGEQTVRAEAREAFRAMRERRPPRFAGLG